MKIQLLRHATTIIKLKSKTILVDPMLSPARTLKPVQASPNQQDNPLTDLPISEEELTELLNNIDAVLLTHTHFDHFDEAASNLIPKNTTVFCQPEDLKKLLAKGFTSVFPIEDKLVWGEICFTRTKGQHGKGVIGKAMGPVSGYFIQCSDEPSLYIAGDTIWCKYVEKALETYNPIVIVVYAGAAQFLKGCPITMKKEDVLNVCSKSSNSNVIAIHMEAVNHCLLTRDVLKNYLAQNGKSERIFIPQDGECLGFQPPVIAP